MSVPTSQERVLSTLNQDGSRHIIHPKVSRGRFLVRRRIVAYALIALFVLLPRIHINGRPAFLIDLISRELSIFGAVFRPSDGFILMLLGLTVVLTVFLVTALWGRVWCGWGCPQTVYLEHVFRPIERFFEGSPSQQQKMDNASGFPKPRRMLKWAVYAALSFALANVFLAYFVGTARLEQWVFSSPLQHLGGFTVVMFVSALMMFDFVYFREQACIVACPYGRLQSALLDKESLIVGYDPKRGEPRAPMHKKLPVVGSGDCVDCGACVATCPTGIDIRNGLQMECVGCAQCIDACDGVMDKLERKRGLIRYTSKDELAGKPRTFVRARVIIYPVLLSVVAGLLAWSISTRSAAAVWVQRVSGPSFVELPDGGVSAQLRIKIENQSDVLRTYSFVLIDAADAQLRSPQPTWRIRGRKSMEVPLFVDVPRASFRHGQRGIQLRVADDNGFERVVQATLLGPDGEKP